MIGVTNNEGIVRKVIAVALALALQTAGLSAPLVHAHPDDHETEHHAGRAVHTHWAAHPHAPRHAGDEPALTASDDDRAVFLDAFLAVPVSQMTVSALAADVFHLHVAAERAALGGVDVVRSHGPPGRRLLPSRAPPPFLS